MAFTDPVPARDRARIALAVALVHGVLGYALVAGLRVDLPRVASDGLALFAVLPPPPDPPPVPPPAPAAARAPRRAGAAAPPNLVASATQVVAPIPVVRLTIPPSIVAAPLPGNGAAAQPGAAPVPGPGSGAGGAGEGTGGGDAGDGPGGGGDGGTPLRWIKGRIRDSDYPRDLLEAGIGGTVGLRFVVGVAGRITDCRVTRSSGNAELDAVTCRLLRERLRYRPTRDAAGRPVPDVVVGDHQWIPHGRSGEADDDDPDR